MSLPRMRTASGVLDEIKKEDPETGITMHYIRGLIGAEVVPVVNAGRKKLVNVDAVIDCFQRGIKAPKPTIYFGEIRRVGE